MIFIKVNPYNGCTMTTNLKETLEKAGGIAAIATLFGISPVSVYEWVSRGRVPADKCPVIERFCNRQVLCEDLNSSVDWAYLRTAKSKLKTKSL